MKYIYFLLFIFLINIVDAQKYDYNWYTGYDFNDDTIDLPYAVLHWNFNTNNLNPIFQVDNFKKMDFTWTINNMSDYDGNYLFSYNGGYLENYKNILIPNSKTKDYPDDVFNQMAVILPFAKDSNIFTLLYKSYTNFGNFVGTKTISKSLINIDSQSMGKILLKGAIVVSDTLQLESISAVKHSNGRDWWVLIFNKFNNSYYSIEVNNKYETVKKNYIGRLDRNLINQHCAFSPNGNFFSLSSVVSHIDSVRSQVVLYNFDRRSGLLSNPTYFQFYDINSYSSIGVCFSPNSKLLYISRPNEILQINLLDSNYLPEKIIEYDGFKDTIDGNFVAYSPFGFLNNAPDGRIYGTSSCCQQRHLFYINRPNLKGKSCDARQHAIPVTMHSNIPSFPNYRLGPIDGSVSDSLGINNVPVAEFRYDQDTIEYKKIEFTNLSWYEPDEWWWDWGDGSSMYYTTVWDTSIIHYYAQDGIYQVCLRAKNMNGEHTICKEIKLGTTGINSLKPNIAIQMYPNPAHNILIINDEEYLPSKMLMTIYDLQGEEVLQNRLYQGSNMIDLENMNAWVYLVEIRERGMLVKCEKLVKM